MSSCSSGNACGEQRSEPHAFRVAEKHYKAYRQGGKKGGFKHTDFTHVVDFSNLESNSVASRAQIVDTGRQCRGKPIHSLAGHEGFLFVPGALGAEEQLAWLQRAAGEYLINNPSNLSEAPHKNGVVAPVDPHSEEGLARLRWVTLGYHFQWTEKKYDPARRGVFPAELTALVEEVSSGTGLPGVTGECGIVNYFHEDSVMCGHVDHSEDDLTKPIVSFSVGQTAVFLLGGETHDVAPTALYIRSGDLLLMGGSSRRCVHGVPRIVAGTMPEPLKEGMRAQAGLPEAVTRFFLEARVNFNVRQHRAHHASVAAVSAAVGACSEARVGAGSGRGMAEAPDVPAVPVQGIIFDLDGTLIDYEGASHIALGDPLAKRGKALSWDLHSTIVGTKYQDWSRNLIAATGLDGVLTPGEYCEEYDSVMAGLYSSIPAWEGTAALLTAFKEAGFPLAIATSSPRHSFDIKMKHHPAILEVMDVVVTGDEVTCGKPSPDIFLEAARRLGCDPTQCVVFEDSPFGVQGAHAAGCYSVALPDPRMPMNAGRFEALAPNWTCERGIGQFDLTLLTLAPRNRPGE